MIQFKANTNDLNNLKKMFSALNDLQQKKAIIKVLKDNTWELEAYMKYQAPESEKGSSGNKIKTRNHPPGYLKASIGTVVGRGTMYPTIWIRPRRKVRGWDAWYYHFVAGPNRHYTKAKPRPFVETAWDEYVEAVKKGLQTDFEGQLRRAIVKFSK